jgi:carboxypeptidase family protein
MAWRIGFLVVVVALTAFLLITFLGEETAPPRATPGEVPALETEQDTPTVPAPAAVPDELPPAGREDTEGTAQPPAKPNAIPPEPVEATADEPAGLAISGHVTGPLGRALDETVVVARSEADPKIWREARTGADGAYRIQPLPTGSYTVTVRALPRIHWFDDVHWFRPEAAETSTPFPAPKRTGIRAGAEGVDFQLLLPAAVLGQVVAADTGKPLPYMILRVISPAGGWRSFNASHAEGHFILAFPTPVTFDLTAKAGGCCESTPLHIALAPGEIKQGVVLRLTRGGVLTGRIVHAGGKPVRFAQIAVKDARTSAFLGIFSGLLPADGRYRVPGLPTARARVEVSTVDYLPEVVEDVDVSETGEVVRNITVRDGGAVHVTVRTAEDEPVKDAVITIKNSETGKSIDGQLSYEIEGKTLTVGATAGLRTDEKGTLVYRPLTPGAHEIGCRHGETVLDPVTVPIAAGRTTYHQFTLPANRH